jgi:hypothetical protein
MVSLSVEEQSGNLRISVGDVPHPTEFHLAKSHSRTVETDAYGIYGYTVSAIRRDGTTLYVFGDPDQWWTRGTAPGLLKRVEIADGVDSEDWVVYDTREDGVPAPEVVGEPVWERSS